jgi:hypothetical protein
MCCASVWVISDVSEVILALRASTLEVTSNTQTS